MEAKADKFDLNLLRIARNEFKPSLLTRILFEGGNKFGVKNTSHIGGAENAGVDLKDLDFSEATNKKETLPKFIDAFMSRSFFRLFVLTISMYTALVIINIPGFVDAIFNDVVLSEPNLTNDKDQFKKRFLKTILFILIFIIFTMVLQIGIIIAMKILLKIMLEATAPKNVNAEIYANNIIKSFFDSFSTQEGVKDMKLYISIERYAMFGLFLFFIVYFVLVKSFLNLITYPNYTDDPNNEFRLERKFLSYYMLTVIYFVMFCLGLTVAHYAYSDPVTLAYFVLLIAVYSLLINFAISYDLMKKILFFWIFMLILLCVVFLNVYFLL